MVSLKIGKKIKDSKIFKFLSNNKLILFIVMVVIIMLSVNHRIKENIDLEKSKTELLQHKIDSLVNENNRLKSLNCITINTSINLNNKNIFSTNKTDIANSVSTISKITREELLKHLDSINYNYGYIR